MERDKWLYYIALAVGIVLMVLILSCGGCQDAVGLRFSPTQAQKQSAELTYQLARKVDSEGTEPKSPASVKLVEGTAASLAYTGRPVVAPNPDEFDTINDQAKDDASVRPDIGGTMDSMLEIGLAIAALAGGAGGIKLAQGLRTMHSKAKGFAEVVQQIKQYKNLTVGNSEWENLRELLEEQTPTTRKMVALEKIKS